LVSCLGSFFSSVEEEADDADDEEDLVSLFSLLDI
jgi:hypothetical protein